MVPSQLNLSSSCAGLLFVVLVAVTTPSALAADYRSLVLADSPAGYWRLGEASGSTVQDLAGSHTGTGTAVEFGRPGAIANDSDTALGLDGANSFVEVPFSPALNPPAFSIECWARPTAAKAGRVICSLDALGGYEFAAYWTSWIWLFCAADSGTSRFLKESTRISMGEWTHLVATGNGSNLCFYVNGFLAATSVLGHHTPNTSAPLRFGLGSSDSSPSLWAFQGDLDEVAVYDHALPPDRVLVHYGVGKYGTNLAPVLVREPSPQTVNVGSPAALEAHAYGDPAPAFQWYKDGVAIPGATTSTFALSATTYADTGVYWLAAQNSLGSTNTQPVRLAVMPPPLFCNLTNGLVLHLKFDGDCGDSSGRANHGTPVRGPGFVPGQIGSGALHYKTDVATGVSNFVTLGTPADLQFSSNVNFSVAYWVRFNGTPGDLPFLCNTVDSFGSDCEGFAFAPSYKRGGWSWSLVLLGGGVTWTKFPIYGTDGSVNDGQWHHLLHSFDREGEGVTYLDGVRVHAQIMVAATTATLSSTRPVNIGQDTTGRYPESGEADIDDLGVWRRALSPYEAECVYLVGKNCKRSFDFYGPVNIQIQSSVAGVEIIWQAGVLETANGISGPWEPVAGAVAPYCRIPANGSKQFFRVRL